MSLIIWKNNASSTMASSITNIATQVTVQAGQGAYFPAPTAGQYSVITLEDVAGNTEVVQCTGRSGDTLTIVRAFEPVLGVSTAYAFASGSRVENRVTAGVLAALLQKTTDTLADTTLSGIMTLGGGGSIRNGEMVATAIRGAAGDTSNQIFVPSGSANPYIGPTSTNVILTKTNLLSNLPAGQSLVPVGCILYWYGTSGTVPAGYHECDGGTYNGNITPNLRDVIIMGAGSVYPQGASGGSNSTITTTGGAFATNTYALTTADLPAHSHRLWVVINDLRYTTGGGNTPIIGPELGNFGQSYQSLTDGGIGAHKMAEDTGGNTAHSHTMPQHSHTYAFPPYRALVPIMKV